MPSVSFAQENTTGFIDDYTFVPYYPYVVHLPVSPATTPPPAILFLHGTGSRGPPSEMDLLCTWNGIGRRLLEYNSNNITVSSALIAEQFLSIMPIAPNETLTEWRIEYIQPIVEKVRSDYGFDNNRLYLSGYSMGARDSWNLLLNDTTYWTAAAISAGEPQTTNGLEALINIPIRHYQGSLDYVSPIQYSNATQNAIVADGGSEIELIIEQNVSHNSMADAPFYADLFNWFLIQNKNNSVSTNVTSNGTTSSSMASGSAISSISTSGLAFSSSVASPLATTSIST